jgi:hypothetical protein
MTTRRRTTPPVPMSPIHRRSWRSLWRRCSCGLKEPCIDRLTTSALYLPTDQEPPPPPPPPAQRQAPRPPLSPTAGEVPHPRVAPNRKEARAAEPAKDGYAPVVFLNRATRAPGAATTGRSAWARVPVPQPGRAGSLTPAQSRRADHAERRPGVPTLRVASPGPTHGSGLPPLSPHHQPRGTGELPARNRPGPGRNGTYEGHRVDDSKS